MRGGLLVRRLGYSGETSAASFGVFRVRGTASIRHCLHTVQRVLYMPPNAPHGCSQRLSG
jgi:hypothetical protein